MALTKGTMDIDNQSGKEIHRGWSEKGHRTAVSSPGNTACPKTWIPYNPVLLGSQGGFIK